MTKKQFKATIRRGLGSAFVELQNIENIEAYKEIVLWACLNNTCYDRQSEDGRGEYLYRIIKVYSDKGYFEKKIISKYSSSIVNIWLQGQLTELLYFFARDGSLEARKALYKKYDKLFNQLSNGDSKGDTIDDRASFEWLAVWLTSLDGFKVFRKIVREVGGYYYSTSDRNSFSMDWFYENAKNKFGKNKVKTFMQKEGRKFAEIQAFFDIHQEDEEQISQYIRHEVTVKDFIEACYDTTSMRRIGVLRQFIKTAREEELEYLAHKAMQETQVEVKRNLLECFTKVKFPLEEDYLWVMLEDEALREGAIEMLAYFPTERLHHFVIERLKENIRDVDMILLLCKCYRKGDEDILNTCVKSLKVSQNESDWHAVFGEVELLIRNNSKVSTGLLMYMYGQTLCSYCRGEIIRTMSKRKVLTRVLLEECVYDSNVDIRKYAGRRLKTFTE